MLLLTAIAAVLMTATSDSLGNRLETGCSGGVTGGGGGTIVTEDGRFFNYVRTTGPEQSLKLIGRDGTRAAAYFKEAERAGIIRVKYDEPSNMTCHLSLTRGTKTYEVAWPIGSRPKKIAKLVDLAEAMKGRS